MKKGFEVASTQSFPEFFSAVSLYFIKVAFVLFGFVPFLVAATICLIAADAGSVILAMAGPLFFTFLLFPATRQYFSACVNTALSYALIPIFVAVIATISVGLSEKILNIKAGGTLSDIYLTTIFFALISNRIIFLSFKKLCLNDRDLTRKFRLKIKSSSSQDRANAVGSSCHFNPKPGQ